MNELPVSKSLEQIYRALQDQHCLVLTAPPGAGKSTLVPLALLEQPWLKSQKILMLQPRRVAAIAVARRMAFMSQTRPGALVGHQVRFSRNTSAATRIEVLTEGILTRKIQSDPFLDGVGLVIFDEFHERSIHSDLCLALCREIQREVRPDLKILVMSATIACESLAKYLGSCPVVAAEGFLHPVEIVYREVSGGRNRFSAMAEVCREIINQASPGESYLVFLPGAGEIALFQRELQPLSGHEIQCLHGSMSIEDQEKILRPGQKPRIVLATNIAETSLTIDGITTVIDSGFCRKICVNHETGLETLELQRISQASARQRAGRAGRLQPGRAYRFWSRREHDSLQEFDEPEIHRLDLAGTILELAGWGISEPEKFAWFETPGQAQIAAAQDLLRQLRALELDNCITEAGKSMLGLPLHPRLSCMLLQAEQRGIAHLAALAAAIISEPDFMTGPAAGDADLFLRLELAQAGNNGPDRRRLEKVRKVAAQLSRLITTSADENTGKQANSELQKVLLAAFPDRLCQLRSDNDKSGYKICSGQGLSLAQGAGDRYIIALSLDARLRKGNNDGRIFLYAPVAETMISEILGHLCSQSREIFFCPRREAILVRRVVRFQELILSETEDRLKQKETAMAEKMLVGHAFAGLEKAFALGSPANKSFINRLQLIHASGVVPELPLVDTTWFREHIEELCAGSFSFAELQKKELENYYFSALPFAFKQKFETLAPKSIRVPSGREVEIEYPDSGEPFIRVKIQEMFGTKETPGICAGKVKLIVHLLSPAQRPMQITRDLESFWKNGYKAIVAELKGRYPKHPWPDDPARGVAFAGTKKQLEKRQKKTPTE